MAFSNDIQAQATCTPAQKEACKKICGDNTASTPAKMAACKRTCSGKSGSASATAVKVVNKAPAKTANCQPAGSKNSAAKINASPVRLVGLDLFPQEKKANCSKPCTAVQE